jgi:AcrR family transcriptional regulator
MKHKSKSVAKGGDPRPQRTRQLISSAFVVLLGRRPYDRIRVSDITRKAQIGRATFYAHFATKDDLLQAELERIVVPMLVACPGESCPMDCTKLFAHIQHGRVLYRALMAGSTRAVTERLVQDVLEARVCSILEACGKGVPRAPDFVPRFVASTILTLLAWSLEQPLPLAPPALQETFRSLVAGSLGLSRQ